MRRTQKSSKNNNKNVNKQQTVTSDASSTVPSGKETLEEIKAIFERLKNELKSRQSNICLCAR
jgi:methyl-accepting chemotaxis protein